MFQNLSIQMLHTTFIANQRFPHTFHMGETLEMHASLRPFSELVLESNHILLLMPLLSSLVIWLAKRLFVLRKNPLLIFYCFPGFSSTCTYYRYALQAMKGGDYVISRQSHTFS